MLSNFYKYPIQTQDGAFMSVEGYWYWLGIDDCIERENLRNVYGFNAKKIGKEILKFRDKKIDNDFENKIRQAIWYKFKKNMYLLKKEYKNLPFEHYYNFGNKIVNVKDRYLWLVNSIDEMKNYIVERGLNCESYENG